MVTKDYISQVRDLTGFSDYKIAKKYQINQSNLSKYSSGKSALSETHAFLFADILGINPTTVMINTKIEHAKNTNNDERLKFWEKQQQKIKTLSTEAKIIIAQFSPIVGDIKGNIARIIQIVKENKNNDLIIFPELAICGYPPEDLLIRNNFIEEISISLNQLTQYSRDIDIIIGAPRVENSRLYNSAFLLRNGKIAAIYNKRKLPNYGIFDEKRYFSAGNNQLIFNLKDQIFSVIICEDTWSKDIIKNNKNIGVSTIISINSSPFCKGKHQDRLLAITKNAKDNNINIIYVNAVGAQDGIVFDGGSFFVNQNGTITHQLPFFKEIFHNLKQPIYHNYQEIEAIYQSLVLGLKDYIEKNNIFTGAVVSLSGGIDSALTLVIAADAIGRENIKAIMMPYVYTSKQSIEDARNQVKEMNILYKEINIGNIVKTFTTSLELEFGDFNTGIPIENIQARTRGIIAMAIANKENKILLTTGNKSEMAVGYATLYGDMAGGYAPLKDIYKTDIYKLATYRNSISQVIPPSVINKEPSAELAPNQLDSNALPSYNVLDKILTLFIEESLSVKEIIDYGFTKEMVKNVISMVKNSEYKRKQSAIGTKITKNSFDKDWRYPLTNKYTF